MLRRQLVTGNMKLKLLLMLALFSVSSAALSGIQCKLRIDNPYYVPGTVVINGQSYLILDEGEVDYTDELSIGHISFTGYISSEQAAYLHYWKGTPATQGGPTGSPAVYTSEAISFKTSDGNTHDTQQSRNSVVKVKCGLVQNIAAVVYHHENKRGRRIYLGPGDQFDLAKFGLAEEISSIEVKPGYRFEYTIDSNDSTAFQEPIFNRGDHYDGAGDRNPESKLSNSGIQRHDNMNIVKVSGNIGAQMAIINYLLEDEPAYEDQLTQPEVQNFLGGEYKNLIQSIESGIYGLTIPAVRIEASRDEDNPYHRDGSNNELIINFSGTIKSHTRGELLRILGLHVFEAILGRPEEGLRCVLKDDNFIHDGFIYTLDKLDSSALQPNTCRLYEAWGEFFVSTVLGSQAHQTSLNSRRRLGLFDVWEWGIFSIGKIASVGLGQRNIDILASSAKDKLSTLTQYSIPKGHHKTTNIGPKYLPSSGNSYVLGHRSCKQKNPIEGGCPSFEEALQLDTGKLCLVFHSDHTESYEQCNNDKSPILCEQVDPEITSPEIQLTQNVYHLSFAELACIKEFGINYMAIDASTNQATLGKRKATAAGLVSASSSSKAGTGTAIDGWGTPRKMRKKDRITQMNGQINALRTKIKAFTDPKEDDFNFLISHAINVGAGSCQAIQCITVDNSGGTKNVESVLVDCGSNGKGYEEAKAFDEDGVLGYLKENYFYADDKPLVVISHGNTDHYSYIKNLMEGESLSDLYFGGDVDAYTQGDFAGWINDKHIEGTDINGYTHASAVNELDEDEIETITTFSNCKLPGGTAPATIKMLTANHGGTGLSGTATNRNSIVLDLYVDDKYSFVFPGDAHGSTETQAATEFEQPLSGDNSIRLLMSSHHGSGLHNSNSKNWLAKILPQYLIYSLGNLHGHPNCNIIDRMEDNDYSGSYPLKSNPSGNHNVLCYDKNASPKWQDKTLTKAHYTTRFSGTAISIYAIPKDNTNDPEHSFIMER